MRKDTTSNRIQTTSRACSAFFAALFLTSNAFDLAQGEGFRIPGLSSDAMSKGEAVVASVNDPSAAWYNPAAMTKSGKLDVSATLNNMMIPSKYTDLSGREETNSRSNFPLPQFYATSNLGTERMAVGLAINTPFGLATEYSKTSAFRYITTGGEIQLMSYNPSVAYKVNKTLSAAAGLQYYHSTAELRQQYPWALVGGSAALPDGSVTIQGVGDGYGFNTAILYEPAENHAIGLTYRSQVNIKYGNKKAELSGIPTAIQPLFGAGAGDVYATGAKTSIRYPDVVSLGYAYKPNSKLTWEIGAQWTNWDDVRSIDIDLDRPVGAIFSNSSTRLDWRNSFTIRTGVNYDWTDAFSVSGGFFSDRSPTNEATYTPLVPDGDHQAFSIGAKYKHNDLTIQVPFVAMIQTGTGSINSSTSDTFGTENTKGKYDTMVFQIGLGVTYRFGK